MRQLLIFLFYFVLIKCPAQIPVMQHYGVNEGLPGSYVYRALQDSRGFIWLLTNRGLSRFDGTRFHNFTMADGLPQNDIFSVGEDKHQRLWIYNYNNSFCYFDQKNNRFHSIPNNTNSSKVGYINYLFETDTGMIAYTSANVIYKIDAYEQVTVLRNGWNPNLARDFPVQRQYPMLTGERILYHKNQDSDKYATLLSGNDMPTKIEFKQDSLYFHQTALADSAFYFIAGDYLQCYYKNNHKRKLLNQLSPGIGSEFTYISVVGGNTRYAFVHTNTDCFLVDENLNRLQPFDFINKFEVNVVNADRDGNFWICTKEDGVYFLEKEVSKTLLVTQRTTTAVKAIVKDVFGNIIFGNNLGEVQVLSKGVLHKINFDRRINFPIQTIKILSEGRMLIQWRNSFFAVLSPEQIYSDKTIKTKTYEFSIGLGSRMKINPKDDLTLIDYPPLKSIGIGNENEIYLAAFTEIHVLKDSANYRVATELGKTPINNCVNADGYGNIWIGTSCGVLEFKSIQQTTFHKFVMDSLSLLKKKYPILTQPIYNVVADRKSNLWITPDLGLYTLQINKLNEQPLLSSIKELSADIVEHIFIDKKNKLWIASNKGIATIEINSENSFQYKFQRLSTNEWLPSHEITALLADSINLYVGTTRGLTIVDLKQLSQPKDSVKQLPLLITGVKINKSDTVLQRIYNLSYNQNTIDISFVALGFQSSKRIFYQYRMSKKGDTDTTWHDVLDLHQEFAYLAPETYYFFLRAKNLNESISTMPEPLVFNIDLPVWRKTWFITLVSMFGILSLLVFNGWRIGKIEKEAERKTAMNRRLAQLELKGLQAQMNPHFIFNALTAIQSFILNKDTHVANDYLTKFSKLMRQFLESSRTKFIPLQDEIDLLKNYVSLEQVRFTHKFDFECTVGANVDTGSEIPSMLLQPFLENAINHGILYKKGFGHLSIDFQKLGKGIVCSINDDGVGRVAAAVMQTQSLKPHRSLATQIMQERVKVLQQVEEVSIAIEVIDKIDALNNSTGTKVIITIL